MNSKRDWTQVTVVVVLALASLSSIAVSVPNRDRLVAYAAPLAAEVCSENSVGRFDQYVAAIEWAEQGGPVPLALSVSCVDENADLTASRAGPGGESWDRFEQYMAAIESTEQAVAPAPVHTATGSPRFEQYLAAIEWAEQGGQLPLALSTIYGEDNPDLTASHTGYGGESWARFEQYMAAIESTEQAVAPAPVHTATGSQARFEQYLAAIEWAEQGGQLPLALSIVYGEDNPDLTASHTGFDGESWARFEQYMAAIER